MRRLYEWQRCMERRYFYLDYVLYYIVAWSVPSHRTPHAATRRVCRLRKHIHDSSFLTYVV